MQLRLSLEGAVSENSKTMNRPNFLSAANERVRGRIFGAFWGRFCRFSARFGRFSARFGRVWWRLGSQKHILSKNPNAHQIMGRKNGKSAENFHENVLEKLGRVAGMREIQLKLLHAALLGGYCPIHLIYPILSVKNHYFLCVFGPGFFGAILKSRFRADFSRVFRQKSVKTRLKSPKNRSKTRSKQWFLTQRVVFPIYE